MLAGFFDSEFGLEELVQRYIGNLQDVPATLSGVAVVDALRKGELYENLRSWMSNCERLHAYWLCDAICWIDEYFSRK